MNKIKNNFIISEKNQTLIVELYAEDVVRVYSSPKYKRIYNKQGIVELNKEKNIQANIYEKENVLILKSKNLIVEYKEGKLIFYNKDIKVLEEYTRLKKNFRKNIGENFDMDEDLSCSALNIISRNFIELSKNDYRSTLLFEADKNEKIYGMGTYDEVKLNKNLSSYELKQRNSQISIPFYISNKNYGFIWNNASVGEVSFSENYKKWTNFNSNCIDYFIIIADSPKNIIEKYSKLIGKAPMIDENLLGLWQSKLRYQTTEEVERIIERYKSKNIKLSSLAIDYYHWTNDGDYEFDLNYWKDIEKLALDTKFLVSIWPTVDKKSKYINKYIDENMLIKHNKKEIEIFEDKYLLDFFNPKTGIFLNKLIEKNYKSKNINLLWLDQAEPEITKNIENKLEVYYGKYEKYANRYPFEYLKSLNKNQMPTLIRSAWFNSQKYGSIVWTGDIESSFDSLKKQIQSAISMGICGISWLTSDIGGFFSSNTNTKYFRELLIRWFQFSVFSPFLRMHGDRQPHTKSLGKSGGGIRTSGAGNEIWSFGKEVEEILLKYVKIRKKLKKYLLKVFEESKERGYPIIRSMFFEFPEDKKCWEDNLVYMLGSELIIAPVTEFEAKNIKIYLPKNHRWINLFDNKIYEGGKQYLINVNLETFGLFIKENSKLLNEMKEIFK